MPGRDAYRQELPAIWKGLATLLSMLDPAPMEELFRRLPTLRIAISEQSNDLLRPCSDPAAALSAIGASDTALRVLRGRFFSDPRPASAASLLLHQLLDSLYVEHTNLPAVHATLTRALNAVFVAMLDLADKGGTFQRFDYIHCKLQRHVGLNSSIHSICGAQNPPFSPCHTHLCSSSRVCCDA